MSFYSGKRKAKETVAVRFFVGLLARYVYGNSDM
jgi:hypothetical protein